MRREDKGRRRETGGYQDRWQETEPKAETIRRVWQNGTKVNQQLKRGRERKAQKQSGEKQPLHRVEAMLAAICPEDAWSMWTSVEN